MKIATSLTCLLYTVTAVAVRISQDGLGNVEPRQQAPGENGYASGEHNGILQGLHRKDRQSMAVATLTEEMKYTGEHLGGHVRSQFDANTINFYDPGVGPFTYAKFGGKAEIMPMLRESEVFLEPHSNKAMGAGPRLMQVQQPVTLAKQPSLSRRDYNASHTSGKEIIGVADFGTGVCINCEVTYTINLNDCRTCCQACTSSSGLPVTSSASASHRFQNASTPVTSHLATTLRSSKCTTVQGSTASNASSNCTTVHRSFTGSSISTSLPSSSRSNCTTIHGTVRSLSKTKHSYITANTTTISSTIVPSGVTVRSTKTHKITKACPTCPGHTTVIHASTPCPTGGSTSIVSTVVPPKSITIWTTLLVTQTLACPSCPGNVSTTIKTTSSPCPVPVSSAPPFQNTSVPVFPTTTTVLVVPSVKTSIISQSVNFTSSLLSETTSYPISAASNVSSVFSYSTFISSTALSTQATAPASSLTSSAPESVNSIPALSTSAVSSLVTSVASAPSTSSELSSTSTSATIPASFAPGSSAPASSAPASSAPASSAPASSASASSASASSAPISSAPASSVPASSAPVSSTSISSAPVSSAVSVSSPIAEISSPVPTAAPSSSPSSSQSPTSTVRLTSGAPISQLSDHQVVVPHSTASVVEPSNVSATSVVPEAPAASSGIVRANDARHLATASPGQALTALIVVLALLA